MHLFKCICSNWPFLSKTVLSPSLYLPLLSFIFLHRTFDFLTYYKSIYLLHSSLLKHKLYEGRDCVYFVAFCILSTSGSTWCEVYIFLILLLNWINEFTRVVTILKRKVLSFVENRSIIGCYWRQNILGSFLNILLNLSKSKMACISRKSLSNTTVRGCTRLNTALKFLFSSKEEKPYKQFKL